MCIFYARYEGVGFTIVYLEACNFFLTDSTPKMASQTLKYSSKMGVKSSWYEVAIHLYT